MSLWPVPGHSGVLGGSMPQWLQSGYLPFPPRPASCVALPGDPALGMPGLSLLSEQCGLSSLGPLCSGQETVSPNRTQRPYPVKLDLLCATPLLGTFLLIVAPRQHADLQTLFPLQYRSPRTPGSWLRFHTWLIFRFICRPFKNTCFCSHFNGGSG